RLGGDAVELLVGERDVAVLLELVALDDVVAGDLLAACGAHPLVADPRSVPRVQHVEMDVAFVDRGVETDGDRDQAERDGALPQGPPSGATLTLPVLVGALRATGPA